MAQETDNYTDYPMFKGLQRPLEFMGLQGRYITWAAITASVGIHSHEWHERDRTIAVAVECDVD